MLVLVKLTCPRYTVVSSKKLMGLFLVEVLGGFKLPAYTVYKLYIYRISKKKSESDCSILASIKTTGSEGDQIISL